jgi:hypothetical protein
VSSAAAVIAGSETLENEDERSLRLQNISNRKLLATQAAFVKRWQAFCGCQSCGICSRQPQFAVLYAKKPSPQTINHHLNYTVT